MADLSTYSPIYIRTTGNDATGDGSLAAPFATAQKGFQTAYLATGNRVLDLGTGSFGGVNLANANATGWPDRIAVQGVSVALSNLGGIYGSYNPNLDYSGQEMPPGHPVPGTITIIGNNTANLGNVTTYYPEMGTGSVTLTDSTAGNITTLSNGSGYPRIDLTNSTAGNLSATTDGGNEGYIGISLKGSSAGDLYGIGSFVHLTFFGSFSYSRILSFDYIQINGVELNGWLDGVYYITTPYSYTSATTLDANGNGEWNADCYLNGQVNNDVKACEGICFGSAPPDDCGVCNGNNESKDCNGVCFGNATKDSCGNCGGEFFISESTTQWVECLNKYYIAGTQTTLPESGTGSWNNKYWIGGVETQLDANGNGFLNGLFYVGGVLANGSVQFSNVPPSPPAWGNFTYYSQGAVVSDNGSLWLLVSTGGWTVGGRPGLGYGWQQLSTGGGGLPTPSVNPAQLLGLPPFVQL